MTKPKTGKAIMTDEELIEPYVGTTTDHNKLCKCKNVVCSEKVLGLMAHARQQGIAEGRVESEKMLFNWKLRYESVEKQAYAKGFKDGTAKYYSRDYAKGVADGQSDLKARLLSKRVIDNVSDSFMTSSVVKSFVKRAIKEAERK